MRHLLYILLSTSTITLFAQKPFLIPFNDNEKWGVVDSNDNIIMPSIYDGVGINYNGDIWLKANKGRIERQQGQNTYLVEEANFLVLDSTGKQILDSFYQSAPIFVHNHAIVKKHWEKVIVSRLGKEIILKGSEFDFLSIQKHGLIKVERLGKYGIIDTNGVELIPNIYDEIKVSTNSRLVFIRKDTKWGIFNNQGKGIAYFKYDDIDDYECIKNRIKVLDFERGWGFIDSNGVEVIPLQYQYVSQIGEGLAYFEKEDKIGFMDSFGKVIVPPKYLYAGYFKEGRAIIGDDEHQGIIDKNGKVILWTKKYEDIDYFEEGLAAVDDGEKYGFIDLNGKEVIPLKYDSASDFSEGLAKVELKNQYGFIDKKGKIVIPIIYDDVDSFFRGLAKVKLGKAEFYINKNGKEYRK